MRRVLLAMIGVGGEAYELDMNGIYCQGFASFMRSFFSHSNFNDELC